MTSSAPHLQPTHDAVYWRTADRFPVVQNEELFGEIHMYIAAVRHDEPRVMITREDSNYGGRICAAIVNHTASRAVVIVVPRTVQVKYIDSVISRQVPAFFGAHYFVNIYSMRA